MRRCSECNEKMVQGYCIDGGRAYYCTSECLHKHITPEEWDDLYEEEGDSYWTEWHDEDDDDDDDFEVIEDDESSSLIEVDGWLVINYDTANERMANEQEVHGVFPSSSPFPSIIKLEDEDDLAHVHGSVDGLFLCLIEICPICEENELNPVDVYNSQSRKSDASICAQCAFNEAMEDLNDFAPVVNKYFYDDYEDGKYFEDGE